MSLLLSQAPAPFNPGTDGFPYVQNADPVRVPVRATAALLTAACFIGFLPPPYDPGTKGFPWPQPYEVKRNIPPRPTGGPTFVDPLGHEKTAVNFNAILDALTITTVPASSSAYTWTGWARWLNFTNDPSDIFQLDLSGGASTVGVNNSGTELLAYNQFGPPQNPTALSANVWYFIALRINGTTATLFKGTETKTAVATTATITAPGALLTLGIPVVALTSRFPNADLSRYRVWNAQLTDAEIELERVSTFPNRTANLAADWRLQNTQNPGFDYSGNGQHLTKNASGTWTPTNAPNPVMDPGAGFPWQQPVGPTLPPARERGPFTAFVYAPAGAAPFDPSTGFPWVSQPDFARGLPPAREGRSVVVPLVAAPAFDPAAGFPWTSQPDFARGSLKLVSEGWNALVVPEREPTTDWAPEFPDFVRSLPRALNVGGAFDLKFGNVVPAPSLPGWEPTFPDFARGARRSVDVGWHALVIQEREPAVDWLPSFPDFTRSLPRLVNVGFFSTKNDPTVVGAGTVASWLPTFPDFTRSAPRPLNVGGSPVIVIQEREPQLDWLPTFVDFTRALPRAVNEGLFARSHVLVDPITSINWLTGFPDFTRSAPRPVNVGGAVFVARQPTTDWEPTFPDFVRGAPRPTSVGWNALVIQEREPTVDWLPTFADFARALRRPLNVGGPAPFRERQVQLDWAPTFVDFTRALPRPLNVGGFAPFVNFDYVRPLAWAPTFADFARSKLRPVNEGGLTFVKLERKPVTDWLPAFPDFARAALRSLNVGGTFDLKFGDIAPLPPAPLLSWSPTFADFARGLAVPVRVGRVALVIPLGPDIYQPVEGLVLDPSLLTGVFVESTGLVGVVLDQTYLVGIILGKIS